MKETKRLASCSIMAALCVVFMLLGAVLELGMYAAPLLVGVCLIPFGEKYGVKYQLMLWIVISILSFMLVPNIEQNLMFAGFFGWYPVIREKLQPLPELFRLLLKLLIFNAVIIAIESLVILVLVPEEAGNVFLLVLLLLGNITFLVYDFAIPRMMILAKRLYTLI